MSDWSALEAECQKHIDELDNLHQSKSWTRLPDMIEDISIDPDEDGIYITLEGDFVYSMLKYLVTSDESDPQYGKITLKLDYWLKDKVVDGLTP